MFGKIRRNALSLHPQSENETYSERQRGSLKSSFEKKSSERFGRDAKMSYLCTTFRSERALKTFEVFLKKIWKVRKKVLPLQPLSASKNEAETNAKSSND